VVSILLCCGVESKDALIAELWEAGTTGIVEHEEELEAFFDSANTAETLLARFAAFHPCLRQHPERDYSEQFREYWRPLKIGRRFWLAPPWDTSATPENRLRIDYQPGMACGSGAHPATQLCMEALERCAGPGSAVLDVGAGSGILLIAAGLLGARLLAGCDTDADSVLLARQAVPRAHLWIGTVESARPASFDVVIANISAAAASEMLDELRRVARPGGRLILSGFQRGEFDSPGAPGRLDREGWLCLTLEA